jgi:hypothetical protein
MILLSFKINKKSPNKFIRENIFKFSVISIMSKNMEFLIEINFHLQIKLKNSKNLYSHKYTKLLISKYLISKTLDCAFYLILFYF